MQVTPSKRQVTAGNFKFINGTWHKLCRGDAHEEPVWLPANTKYFYPSNSANGKKLHSQCRLCNNWHRLSSPGSEFGLVEVSKVWHFYAEAVARVGVMELAKRSGVHYTAISKVLDHRVKHVRKQNFKQVLLELISMRRKNEHSINVHARWRNERRLIDREGACSGCGTPLANYTEACTVCTERKLSQKKRSGMSPEKREEILAYDRARQTRRREAKRLSRAA